MRIFFRESFELKVDSEKGNCDFDLLTLLGKQAMTLFCSYCLLKLGKMRTQLYMYRAVQVQIFLLFHLVCCFMWSYFPKN